MRAPTSQAFSSPASGAAPDNASLAAALDRVAELLEAQEDNRFRIAAYRRAASAVRGLDTPVAAIAQASGRPGLERALGIGHGLSAAIGELVHTGRLRLLDRLEGQVAPEDLFATVPGIGEELAHRVHDALHIDTLEELEVAAHDGRLDAVPGFGPRRIRGIRAYLADVLQSSTRRGARERRLDGAAHPEAPPVTTLLDIDAHYRTLAAEGKLRAIAPRRFNPHGDRWLPVWHTHRDGWSFTVLYSNSGLAHRLGKTRDWVVIYYDRAGDEDQCTVVTETRGSMAGRRVVRGREAECRESGGLASREEIQRWAHELAEGPT